MSTSCRPSLTFKAFLAPNQKIKKRLYLKPPNQKKKLFNLEFHWDSECILISESTTAPEKCAFSVLAFKSLKHRIRPCRKIGEGQPRAIICIKEQSL